MCNFWTNATYTAMVMNMQVFSILGFTNSNISNTMWQHDTANHFMEITTYATHPTKQVTTFQMEAIY